MELVCSLWDGHVVEEHLTVVTLLRWKLTFFNSVDGGDDTMTVGLMYGKEKHHDGSARLATYTGWEAGLLYQDFGDDVNLSGGVFVGANYYIADNLYIGTEQFSAAVNEDAIGLALVLKVC